MDQRTKDLFEDFDRWQEGGEGNSFVEIAREWAAELAARREAEEAAFEVFFADLGTLVVRCR